MDRLGDSRGRAQAVQNAAARLIVPEARRRDRVSPILRGLHWLPVRRRVTFFQVLRNCAEVCQRRRSHISTRVLCPSGGCPWSPTTAVRVNSLDSTASPLGMDSGASRTANLQCGTVFQQPCAKTSPTFTPGLRQN